MKRNPGIKLSIACALTSVLFWGSTAVIVRHMAILGVSTSVIAFVRCAVGGTVLLLGLRLFGYRTPNWPAVLKNRWLWLATVCYGINMLVYHWALGYTSASVVMLLENTAPVTALVGGIYFFKDRLRPPMLVALALAMFGVWLTCSADLNLVEGDRPWLGNLLGLLSGITWAGYIISCHGLGKQTHGLAPAIQAMGIMLLGSVLMMLPAQFAADWSIPAAAWPWILMLGLVHTSLGTVLWRLALNQISAFTASLLFQLTIVVTMTLGAVFLDEAVTWRLVLGGIAIVSALFVARSRRPRESA